MLKLISFFKERMISRNLIFGLILFNLILLFLSAAGFSHLEFGDNQLQEKINFYKEKLSRGVIIDDRPSTYIFGEDSTIFYFKIMILRYCYFFAPYAQEFSLVHKLYNLVYFGVIYFGIACCLINFEKFQRREKLIINKTILFITSFAVFHSIYIIDYDWRYRMPVYVPMLILSYYGYKLFFDRYIQKLNLKLDF